MTTQEYWEARSAWLKEHKSGSLLGAPPLGPFDYNPVDKVRLHLVDLFARKKVALGCSGQCFLCSDFQVIACLIDSYDLLDIKIKEDEG